MELHGRNFTHYCGGNKTEKGYIADKFTIFANILSEQVNDDGTATVTIERFCNYGKEDVGKMTFSKKFFNEFYKKIKLKGHING